MRRAGGSARPRFKVTAMDCSNKAKACGGARPLRAVLGRRKRAGCRRVSRYLGGTGRRERGAVVPAYVAPRRPLLAPELLQVGDPPRAGGAGEEDRAGDADGPVL